MYRRLKQTVRLLAAALLLAGFLGYCTPDASMPWVNAGAEGWTFWQHVVTLASRQAVPLMLAGLLLGAFNLLLLPFMASPQQAAHGALRFWRNLPLTVFMLPGVLCLLVFNYLPMPGIVLAFKQFKKGRGTIVDSIAKSVWNGIKSFNFLETPTAQGYIRNTLLYNLFWLVLGLVVAVTIAIGLSHLRSKRAAKSYQTFIFMPYFISWVIASYLLYALISHDKGLLGGVWAQLGLAADRKMLPNLYQAPQYWPLILTAANQWKYMGYNSIIYTAAISGIDTQLYEAAMLDGASTWQRVKHITIPLLKPMMIIMTIMAMGRVANADFGLFFNLPMDSGPLKTITGVYDTYVFRMITGSSTVNYSTVAAASLFQSVLGFVLIFSTNLVVRKISPDNSLF